VALAESGTASEAAKASEATKKVAVLRAKVGQALEDEPDGFFMYFRVGNGKIVESVIKALKISNIRDLQSELKLLHHG
jgi:hypothetical protein